VLHRVVDQPSSSTETRNSLADVIEGSSRLAIIDSPPPLRCTFPSCTAKEEDKVFTGKGATSAHKFVPFLFPLIPNTLCFIILCPTRSMLNVESVTLITSRRHMDSHNKPYICPDVKCRRHTSGFSRRDNLANHMKSQHNKKKHRAASVSGVANPLGVLGGRVNENRRKNLEGMSGHDRRKLMDTLLILIDLGFNDGNEENNPENDIDTEEMEQDED